MSWFKIASLFFFIANHSVFGSKLDVVRHVQSEKSGSLQNDLNEFLNIIPVDDIRNLTEYFYANDEAMRNSYDYLRTDGYKLVVENFSSLTLVKKFTAFLNDTGVNFAELGKRIEKIVLTDEEAKSIVVDESNDDLGGMNGFFNEALQLIPQDEVLTLFFAKMEESNAFSSFLEKLNASDYENLTANLKKSQGIQSIYFDFLSHGIDIMEIGKSMRKFVGY